MRRTMQNIQNALTSQRCRCVFLRRLPCAFCPDALPEAGTRTHFLPSKRKNRRDSIPQPGVGSKHPAACTGPPCPAGERQNCPGGSWHGAQCAALRSCLFAYGLTCSASWNSAVFLHHTAFACLAGMQQCAGFCSPSHRQKQKANLLATPQPGVGSTPAAASARPPCPAGKRQNRSG